MPTVPQRTVGSAPLPGVRVNPNVPVAAFPGAINARPDLSGVQHVVNDLHQQAVDRADQVANLDNDNQLSAAASQIEQNALSLKGKNAMGALQQARADWEKQTAGIGVSAATDRQKMFLQARAAMRWQQLNETIERHAANEGQQYDNDVTNAALSNRMNDALTNYRDPGIVTQAVDESRAVIADQAKRLGMAPEAMQQAQAEQVSKIHTSVVDRYLTAGDDLSAQAYYAQHQGEILGSDQGRIDKALEVGSTLGAAQRAGDAITKSATTLTDALSKAGEIDNPKVREATERQIRQHFEDAAFADRQDREAAFDQAKEIVRQNGGDSTKVPPSLLNKLNTTQEEEVRRIGRNIRYPDHITDEAKYTNLLNFASVSPASFLDIDIRKEYGEDLSRNDLAHVEALQRKVREGQNRAETTADTRVKRGQEKVVLDQAKAAQKVSDNIKNLPADVSKFLPSPKPVTVPQWMLDSAKTNKPYADYLRMHGVNLDHAATTQAQPTAPRVPGGPLGPAKPIDLTKATP